jgi:hypothetical protein
LRICLCSAVLGLLTMGCSREPISFTAPPGWIGTPSLLNLPRGFKNPANPQHFILIAYPSDPRPTSYPTREKWTPIRICGNHPAMLMQMRGVLNDRTVQMDGVDTTWHQTRVMAMYARPFGSRPDPAAEAAIRSLCE